MQNGAKLPSQFHVQSREQRGLLRSRSWNDARTDNAFDQTVDIDPARARPGRGEWIWSLAEQTSQRLFIRFSAWKILRWSRRRALFGNK